MVEKTTNKINAYLTFRLGDELFAANVSKVLNIVELTKITQVPRMPNYMLGIINLRGLALPVIDIRKKFAIELLEYSIYTCILVLEVIVDNKAITIGALVDAVNEVIDIDDKDLLPPPSFGIKYKADFITSVYKKENDDFVMVLDLDFVFSNNEILELNQNKERV